MYLISSDLPLCLFSHKQIVLFIISKFTCFFPTEYFDGKSYRGRYKPIFKPPKVAEVLKGITKIRFLIGVISGVFTASVFIQVFAKTQKRFCKRLIPLSDRVYTLLSVSGRKRYRTVSRPNMLERPLQDCF